MIVTVNGWMGLMVQEVLGLKSEQDLGGGGQ